MLVKWTSLFIRAVIWNLLHAIFLQLRQIKPGKVFWTHCSSSLQ
nr:MAG TPA: hypothetical protein [Bacteriophage sp.]